MAKDWPVGAKGSSERSEDYPVSLTILLRFYWRVIGLRWKSSIEEDNL